MPHIVIDARILFKSTGRYVRNLIEQLQDLDRTNRYTILLLKEDFPRWHPRAENFDKVVADFPPYTLGEQIGLAAVLYRLRPDLVHFAAPEQPLLWLGPSVTAIHDLTLMSFVNRRPFNALKSFYKYTLKPAVFRTLLGLFARRSRHVITPSNYVRNQVIDRLRVPARRVTTTYEAVDKLAERAEAVPELQGRDFVFFVGNAFVYKNLHRLMDAVAVIPNIVLAIAGKRDFYYEQLILYARGLGYSNVEFPGFVSDAQLVWMYQNAKMYVIPSLSEGFSLTGLEAMYYGLPVASSSATCLPEIYGNAAVYFDPYDVLDIRAKVWRTLDDPTKLDALAKRGREQIEIYSWKRMAEQTLKIYEAALHAKRRDVVPRPARGIILEAEKQSVSRE
jgi:glycosyltransferase involved in cell wall biosynthesis